MATQGKVFLVVRRTWNIDQYYPADDDRVPVQAFANREGAEAVCRKLEDEARRQFDVWKLFGDDFENLDDEESDQEPETGESREAPEDRLKKALARLGLPKPGKKHDWYEHYQPAVTAEQRLALWEAVGSAKVYEVIEVPMSR